MIFGFLIVGAIFRTGEFGLNDLWLVYVVLGGYSIGLLATTMSRLLQNAFYALNNTKTPAKIAALRVAVSAALAVPLMFLLDQYSVMGTVNTLRAFVGLPDLAIDQRPLYLGSVGLALGATIGAWVELWRLKRSLTSMVPVVRLPWDRVRRMVATSLFSAVPAVVVWLLLPDWHVALKAVVVLGVYAFGYLGASYLQDAPEMEAWTGRVFSRD